jgi:uncharacterized protein YdaU (DUF1376 family)
MAKTHSTETDTPGKAPAFQFYAKDFLTDEKQAGMTLEQAGAYIRLLCYCWREQTIPDEPAVLALMVGGGITAKRMAAVWPAIRACFEETDEPGRLRHGRLERERQKQEDWRQKSAKGGRHTQAGRKGGSTTDEPPSQANANTPVSVLRTPYVCTTEPAEGGAGEAWEQWRQAWEQAGRTALPLTVKSRDFQHCLDFATRYPDADWRALMLSACFVSDDPQVRKSPPSLGWFVSTWMDEIDKRLRDTGRRPKTEVAA